MECKKKYKRKRNFNELNEENSINIPEKAEPFIKIGKLPKIHYYNFINDELENNNPIDTNERELYNNITNNLINIYISKIENFKVLIPENYFNITSITPDGNCFFRSVSKYFSDSEEYHMYFRNVVYNYINIHKNEILINNNIVEINNRIIDLEDYLRILNKSGTYSGELEISTVSKIFNISIYVLEINETYNRYRLLYKIINDSDFISYCMILNHVYLNKNKNSKSQHYELLTINPFTFDIKYINNNDNLINNNLNSLHNQEKNLIFKNDNNINLDTKLEKSKINDEIIEDITKNYFNKNTITKEISIYDKNKTNSYNNIKETNNKIDETDFKTDIINNINDNSSDYKESKNMKEYIQNDLNQDKIINNKLELHSQNNKSKLEEDSININNIIINEFPNIVIDIKNTIHDINMHESEKINLINNLCNNIKFPSYNLYYKGEDYYLDKYKYLLSSKISDKIRIYPDYIQLEEDYQKLENKKRMFRSSIINYDLDDELFLCFKKLKNTNKNYIDNKYSNNRHKKKNSNDYILYKIPMVNNIIKVIDDIHKAVLHQGKAKMIDVINEKKIFYHGIKYDVENINRLCNVCIQKKVEFYKREPCKLIIMNEPRDRYIIDLTYLTYELYEGTEYRYLLNIVDHFSKYLLSYLITKKSAKIICEKLEHCFKTIGVPKQIGSDNGSEFVNKKVKNLLNKNNIKFIHGKPYNPHSQGVVERVHRTIRTALICKYLEDKKNFNLVNSLNIVTSVYNNLIHNTTKKKPIEIFYSKNKDLFSEVKINTINSSKNYNSGGAIFKKYDYLLLFNNFEKSYIKKKNLYLLKKSKIKKRNVLYNICATLIANDNGQYTIMIEKNYKDYNLNKHDLCLVDISLIKKIDYDIWVKLLNN